MYLTSVNLMLVTSNLDVYTCTWKPFRRLKYSVCDQMKFGLLGGLIPKAWFHYCNNLLMTKIKRRHLTTIIHLVGASMVLKQFLNLGKLVNLIDLRQQFSIDQFISMTFYFSTSSETIIWIATSQFVSTSEINRPRVT